MARIKAPWTEQQVEAIHRWQTRGDVPPFTCPHHSDVPLDCHSSTLYCTVSDCSYSQNWVHDFMAGGRDGS